MDYSSPNERECLGDCSLDVTKKENAECWVCKLNSERGVKSEVSLGVQSCNLSGSLGLQN